MDKEKQEIKKLVQKTLLENMSNFKEMQGIYSSIIKNSKSNDKEYLKMVKKLNSTIDGLGKEMDKIVDVVYLIKKNGLKTEYEVRRECKKYNLNSAQYVLILRVFEKL